MPKRNINDNDNKDKNKERSKTIKWINIYKF